MSSSALRPSARRRTELRVRIALGVSVALFVVGGLAFLQARSDTGPAPTPASKEQLAQPDQAPEDPFGKPGGTLVPAAREVASSFLMSALLRENLASSWALATPDFRSAVTRKQWLAGELPVPPFPVRSLASTVFTVVGSTRDRVQVQMLVLPPAGNKKFEPLRYDMTLEKRGGRWLVSYLVPYAPVPVQSVS